MSFHCMVKTGNLKCLSLSKLERFDPYKRFFFKYKSSHYWLTSIECWHYNLLEVKNNKGASLLRADPFDQYLTEARTKNSK
jgi:hypothetical protein